MDPVCCQHQGHLQCCWCCQHQGHCQLLTPCQDSSRPVLLCHRAHVFMVSVALLLQGRMELGDMDDPMNML